jgi:hypothetical protein
MILCEWDAPEGDPGQSCVHLFARILSTSFRSVSIFSVCCYSSVSISMCTSNALVSFENRNKILNIHVRHVTGNDEDYLRKIPRVVVQKSALL